MSKALPDMFMYLFEAFLLYNYADNLFYSIKSKLKKITAIAIVTIILYFVYQFGNTLANTVFMFILYIVIFCTVFGTRLKTAVFHTALFVSIMAVSEIIVINISSSIFNDFDAMHTDIKAYIFVITVSKILYASIMLVIKGLCVAKFNEVEKDTFYWVLFLFPLISAIISFLFFFVAGRIAISTLLSLLISGIFILLLFTNLIIFIIYDRAYKNRMELYELKAIHFQQEIDHKYFDAIEQSQKEIQHFSHDMKNHLLQIRYIDEIDEIHKYLDDIINDVEKISYVGISSNKMLNLIISKYSAICEKKKINFTAEVKLANLQHINEVDLSTMLNNLLDNAVESAEKSENGKIEFSIFSKNSRFDGVIIRNTCSSVPNHNNKELRTSKKEKNVHGMGISIVKKILKKYDAIYDWKYDKAKKIFETNIAFPKVY